MHMRIQRELHPVVQFMVFSDNVKTCRGYLQLISPDVHFANETNEVRALVQMTKCVAGGICWNSSFSWWGGGGGSVHKLESKPNRYLSIALGK